jgi:hypothetical protein
LLIRNASLLVAAGVLTASLAASAQTQTAPPTPFEKQLARIDLGVSAIGQFNKDVSGVVPNNGSATRNSTVSESAGNTAGAYVNVRYIAKPYAGLEFNYTYARYTETFNVSPYQIQTGVNEYSFGYVITPRHQILGLQPFVSLAAGSTRFRPTKGGGQSAPTQWRATYSYNIGLQKEFGDSHFGARIAFRQAFFKAPDFLLNYLTINQQTTTYEPTIGFFARF